MDALAAGAEISPLVNEAGNVFALARIASEFLPGEILQALPVAVYTTDAAGRIVYYNDAAVALWGCRPELGKSEWCGSWRLYWPDGRPMPNAQWP